VICAAAENWRRHVRVNVTDADPLGPAIPRLDERMEIRQYACPACLTLLATDVTRADAEPLHDIELAMTERE
jgi:acetone carboxylase gamma subunit